MEIINTLISWIGTGTSYMIPMIILLGVLIFIHELGHFAMAKYFGVKVETFSLGFGPKIWKMVRGETTYCLSAIPFGGYVKMFGDELGGNVPQELRNRSFLHKPIYQRILIALAGPVMNLFLAYVLFVGIGFLGERVLSAKLGDIVEDTPAFKMGFRSGDRVLSLDNKPITRWDDIEDVVAANPESDLKVVLSRESLEEPVTIVVTPDRGPSKNIFRQGSMEGVIDGLDFMSNASLVAVSDPQSIFGRLGFQTGDQILSVNNVQVNTFRSINDILLAESAGPKIVFKIDRYGTSNNPTPTPVSIEWNFSQIPFPESAARFGFEKPETFVGAVSKDSPAQKAGVQENDQIVKINNLDIRNFKDIMTSVSSYQESQGPLQVSVRRAGEIKTFSIVPAMTEIKSEVAAPEKRFAIGITPIKSTHVDYTHWRASSVLEAFTWSAKKTWQWTHATVMSFALVITNKVSAKNLGGFISIGQMAQKSWELGLDSFLRIMAIISLNLFILNLLPIPVLDGGHIVLFTIEAIKGTPLSLRKLEIAQQIGVFFLLSLLAFSLFNDVTRLFGFS